MNPCGIRPRRLLPIRLIPKSLVNSPTSRTHAVSSQRIRSLPGTTSRVAPATRRLNHCSKCPTMRDCPETRFLEEFHPSNRCDQGSIPLGLPNCLCPTVWYRPIHCEKDPSVLSNTSSQVRPVFLRSARCSRVIRLADRVAYLTRYRTVKSVVRQYQISKFSELPDLRWQLPSQSIAAKIQYLQLLQPLDRWLDRTNQSV